MPRKMSALVIVELAARAGPLRHQVDVEVGLVPALPVGHTRQELARVERVREGAGVALGGGLGERAVVLRGRASRPRRGRSARAAGGWDPRPSRAHPRSRTSGVRPGRHHVADDLVGVRPVVARPGRVALHREARGLGGRGVGPGRVDADDRRAGGLRALEREQPVRALVELECRVVGEAQRAARGPQPGPGRRASATPPGRWRPRPVVRVVRASSSCTSARTRF